MPAQKVVIIGAGQTGGTAALGLRRLGFGGAIDIIGTDSHIPYERPPLSKSYLAGEPYSSHDLLPTRIGMASTTSRSGRAARRPRSTVLSSKWRSTTATASTTTNC